MSVQEEVFRVRYEEEGSEKLAKLQGIAQGVDQKIQGIKARMAGPWSTKELDKLSRELKRAEGEAALVAREMIRTEAQIRRSAAAGAREVEAAEARKRKAIEATEERERRRQARDAAGSGGARKDAAIRTTFAVANMAQDYSAAGMRGIANNLINPMMWTDLARTIGGGRVALAGFGTVAVAAGVAVAGVARAMHNAGLEFGDVFTVFANLGPVEEAVGTLGELAGAIDETFGITSTLSTVETWIGDVGELAVGWRTATAEVRRHKEELAAVAAADARVLGKLKEDGTREGGLAGKFKSGDQKDEAKRQELIGQALAEMGGKDGINGLIAKLGGTGAARMAVDAASQGDPSRLKMMASGRLDMTGLDMAMRGTSAEIEKEKAEKAAKEKERADKEAAGAREKADRERESVASRWSGAMQDRYTLGRAAGGEASEASIAAEMERSGLAPAMAKALAATVLAQLETGYLDTVATRAAGRGESFDEAAAGLVADEGARKADEARRLAEEQRRAAEEADRPRREALAGRRGMIDRRADLALQFDALRGGDGSAVAAQLAASLKAQGLGGEADAKEIVDERRLALQDRIDQAMFNGTQGQGPAFRQVETLDAGSYIRRVQDGAAGVEREQLDVSKQMLDQLTQLARRQGGFFR